jgi:UDP-2,3-diacylglucosamine pyrophosphatase LpxH
VSGPGRIVVAGDWHGNTRWAVHVISRAAEVLAGEERPLILQLGDFGVWPGGDDYIAALRETCERYGVHIWFIDGNHEDFTQLQKFRNADPVRWLPRGYRWQWHSRTWLALGGAVSLDRVIRTEGRDWWPQEEITEEQAVIVTADGPADVMVTHDCPSGVVHSFSPPSFWDPRDIARGDRHRERLQGVVDEVRPRWLLHGHLHRAYQRHTDFGYGPIGITGLDCDGADLNWTVLDVRQMTWYSD